MLAGISLLNPIGGLGQDVVGWLGHAISEGIGSFASWAIGGVVYARSLRRKPPAPVTPMAKRATWRMPALNLLQRPTWSRGRLLAMYLLRGYLVVAVLMLLVKAVELGVHPHG